MQLITGKTDVCMSSDGRLVGLREDTASSSYGYGVDGNSNINENNWNMSPTNSSPNKESSSTDGAKSINNQDSLMNTHFSFGVWLL